MIEWKEMGDIRLPVCPWCHGVIFLGDDWVGDRNYVAHDECHEIQV